MTIFVAPNFLSEGVRCGLDKEKERMGHTIAYFPFALWIERSQMTPYHKKLKFAGAVGNYYGVNLGLVTILLVEARLGGGDEVVVEVALNEVDGAAAEAATHDA